MATYTTEPKDIDILQLEEELGVTGVHICHFDGRMTVEAGCTKTKLEAKVAAHTPDPALAVAREAAAAQARADAEAEKEAAAAAIKTKLNLTDDDLAALKAALT